MRLNRQFRIGRTVRLDGSVEAFNLTNRREQPDAHRRISGVARIRPSRRPPSIRSRPSATRGRSSSRRGSVSRMPVRRWLVRCAIALAVAAATARRGRGLTRSCFIHSRKPIRPLRRPYANPPVVQRARRTDSELDSRHRSSRARGAIVEPRSSSVTKASSRSRSDAIDPGPYTVLWRINSIDGHQVQGYFGFGVNAPPPGDETMREAALVRTSVPWAVYAGTVKWIGLVALSVWLGGLGFLVAVYAPTLSRAASEDVVDRLGGAYQRIRATIWCAAAAYLVAECVGFVNHAATLADAPLADVLSPPVLANVVTKTNFGWWWGVRMAGAIALCAAFVAGVKRSQGERDLSAHASGVLRFSCGWSHAVDWCSSRIR